MSGTELLPGDPATDAPALGGATVTITGGTGSFGSTMVRHLLAHGVGQVNILSRDEAKQDALRRQLGDHRVKFFLGDVRDAESVRPAVRGAEYVFHAAALKQVPSCEFFPQQAVKTNVLGSHNVLEESARAGVSSLVCLSTDKAVYPVNAMGMSKALMERTAQAFARNNPEQGMTVSVTRYGNVLYSRGSVVPMFVQQALEGRPLTLTEPAMTRFLMTLQESVSLVLHAFRSAEPGDLFVRKAPASTVETLARAVAGLVGEPGPVLETLGTRHGEKWHETLLSSEEMAHARDEGDYFRVPIDARSLEYELYFDEGEPRVAETPEYNSQNTRRLDVEATRELLLRVPELAALVTEVPA